MAPWKLPLIVAVLVLPLVAGFLVAGPALGTALGALAVVVILVVAARQRPRGPIGSLRDDGRRRVLLVTACAAEEPDAVRRIVAAVGLADGGEEAEVRVLLPARIGFLDRWASDVEGSRQEAQQSLVATVAELAKLGVAAEARVGEEDVVQAVEDQLHSFPATEVVLVSGPHEREADAAAELGARLRADFHNVVLDGS